MSGHGASGNSGVGGAPQPRDDLDDVGTQVVRPSNVIGQFVIVEGPGKGQVRQIFSGTNQVGRSSDSRIALDFGDMTISRDQHAIVIADQGRVDIRDGGKSNRVLVNGQALDGVRTLAAGDVVKIGSTALRFDKA